MALSIFRKLFGSNNNEAASPTKRVTRKVSLRVETLEAREVMNATFPGYTLESSGNLYNAASVKIDSAVVKFAVVNNVVIDLDASNTLKSMKTDGSAKVPISTNARSFAVAGNGDVIWLSTTNGNVYDQYNSRVGGASAWIATNICAMATAGNGDIMLLNTNGNVYDQYNPRVGGASTWIATNISSMAIAGNGDVMLLNTNGNVYDQYNPRVGGASAWIATNISSTAIAGNGDVMLLNTNGNVYDQYNPRVGGASTWIATNICAMAIAGNGDVMLLNTNGNVYDQYNPRVGGASTWIATNISSMAIAGNGDVILRNTGGYVYDQYNPRVGGASTQIAAGMSSAQFLTLKSSDTYLLDVFMHYAFGYSNSPADSPRYDSYIRAILNLPAKEIQDSYELLGGINSYLGAQTEPPIKTDQGQMVLYLHGAIILTRDRKLFILTGSIMARYVEVGGLSSELGAPVHQQGTVRGSSLVEFERGAITARPGEPVFSFKSRKDMDAQVKEWSPFTSTIMGDIYSKWKEKGGPYGMLGLPTSDEQSLSRGIVAKFENGLIYHLNAGTSHLNSAGLWTTTAETGAITNPQVTIPIETTSGTYYLPQKVDMLGQMRQKLNGLEPDFMLGFPTGDVQLGPNNSVFCTFEKGLLVWTQARGFRTLTGTFALSYLRSGGPARSDWGLPVSGVVYEGDGRSVIFEHAVLHYDDTFNGNDYFRRI